MTQRNPDPEWRRFRRILWWMTAFALAATLGAELILYYTLGELQIATAIATAVGVFLTIMMGAALMGLMFVSSASGHDEQVEHLNEDEPADQ